MSPQESQIPSSEFLRGSVGESWTREDIKAETLRILEEASQIRERLSWNEDAQREYEMVRLATISALADFRSQTREDLEQVRNELTNSTQEQDYSQWNIDDDEMRIIRRKFEGLDRLDITTDLLWYARLPENIRHLRSKPFWEYSQDDAVLMLRHFQRAYNTYWNTNAQWVLDASERDSWKDIYHQRWVNQVQELLIEKIYWTSLRENGFDDTRIISFNPREWWNSVILVNDFQQQLRHTAPSEWNSLGLINYFKYLESKNWDINLQTLLWNIPASQIIALWELWETHPNWPAMRYFQKSESLNWIIEWLENINLYDYIRFWKIEDILHVMDAMWEDAKQSAKKDIFDALFDNFDDLHKENQNSCGQLQILSNLDAGDSYMIWYLKNTAEIMLAASNLIISIEETYGSPGLADELMIDTFVKMLLHGEAIKDDVEWIVNGWIDDINTKIQEYNAQNENATYPEFDISLVDGLLNIRYSVNLAWNLAELTSQLENIEKGLEELHQAPQKNDSEITRLEVAKRQTERTIANLQSKYTKTVSTLQSTINNFTERKELISSDIRYILEDPIRRISRIPTTQLVQVFQQYPERLKDIKLEHLSPFSRTNIDVILNFPWILDFQSPHYIWKELLADKRVLEKFLSQTTAESIDVLWIIIHRVQAFWWKQIEETLYTSLQELSVTYPISGRYKELLVKHEEYNIHFTEASYIDMNYTESNLITDIEQLNLDTPEDRIKKIHNYIRYHRPRSKGFQEVLIELATNNPDIYKKVLQPRWGIFLDLTDSDIIIISQDPHYYSDLTVNLRWDITYINALLHSIQESASPLSDYLHILSTIPLTEWKIVIHIFDMLGSSNLEQEIWKQINAQLLSHFTTQALFAFNNRDSSKGISDRENQIAQILIWLQKMTDSIGSIWEKNREINKTAEEYRIEFDYPTTLTFITEKLHDDYGHLKNLLVHSKSPVQFVEEFTDFLIQKGIPWEELKELLGGILISLDEDQIILWNMLQWKWEWKEHYTWIFKPWEDWILHIHPDFIDTWNQFRKEKGVEGQNIDIEIIFQLFLTEIWFETDDPNIKTLRKAINIDTNRAIIQHINKHQEAFITAVKSWDTTEFINQARQAYFRGEISSWLHENNNQDITNTSQLTDDWDYQELPVNFRERLSPWNNGRYILSTSDWTAIPITRQDVGLIANNERAEENLISAFLTFEKLWLWPIWEYKDPLITVLSESDMSGQKFNIRDGEYIDRRELNILLSKILYITTQNEKYKNIWLSLEDTKWNIRSEINGVFWEENARNVWDAENRIVESYMDNFTERDRWDAWRPKFEALKQALRWEMEAPQESNETEFVWV